MARKEKKYHYIYKTTNVLSGRYYIGMHSTDNLEDGYLGSGTRLRRAINKHGAENFKREILEYCKSRELLKAREENIVSLEEIAKVDCLNLKVGGYGGLSSGEHRLKFVDAGHKKHQWLLNNNIDYKKKHDETLLKSLINNHRLGKITPPNWSGKKHSEETKHKMSESSKGMGKGEDNSQFGSCWITNESESKKIKRSDEIPKGWRLGRKIK
jgi:hypothetical protein